MNKKSIDGEDTKVNEDKIKRINTLYRKSKAEGLTELEKEEQALLRREYIEAMKANIRSQLQNVTIQEKDGTLTYLGEKIAEKEGH